MAKIGNTAFKELVSLINENLDIKVKSLIFEIIEENIGKEDFDLEIIFSNLFSDVWIIRHQCAKILSKLGVDVIEKLILKIEASQNDELIFLTKEIIVSMDENENIVDTLISIYEKTSEENKPIVMDLIERCGTSLIKKPLAVFKNIKNTSAEIHKILINIIEKLNIRDVAYSVLENLKKMDNIDLLNENIDIMDIIIDETTIKNDEIIMQMWNVSLKDIIIECENKETKLYAIEKLKKNLLTDQFDICVEILKRSDDIHVYSEILSIIKENLKEDIVEFLLNSYFNSKEKDINVTDIVKKLPEEDIRKIICYLKEKNWQKRTEVSELIYSYSELMFIPLIKLYSETSEWFFKENIMKVLKKLFASRSYLFISNQNHDDETVKEVVKEFLNNTIKKEN